MTLLALFLSFFQIGLFSFGGGYAAMPLIEYQIVQLHHWLSPSDFNNLITISQMTPGPIAINGATFVGVKVAGFLGAITATIACVLPSCIVVTSIAIFYLKYKNLAVLQSILKLLRPAIIAMILSAGISILLTAVYPSQNFNIQLFGIFIFALIALRKYHLDPILVMLASGVIHLLLSSLFALL